MCGKHDFCIDNCVISFTMKEMIFKEMAGEQHAE